MSKIAHFGNLVFENGTKRVNYIYDGGVISRMNPPIFSDEFEITFKAEGTGNSWQVCYGVVHEDYPKVECFVVFLLVFIVTNIHIPFEIKKAYFGYVGSGYGKGWGAFTFYGNRVQANFEGSCKSVVFKDQSDVYKDGDLFGMKVNKTEKKFELTRNGEVFGEIGDCNFPDKLFIAIGFPPLNAKYCELVDFKDHDFPRFYHRILDEDAKERLEYVHETFSNFEIPLANQTLNFVKLFFIQAKNLPEEILLSKSSSTWNGLSDLSLDVDEFTILKLLLGYSCQIPILNQLIDYFLFFKRLGYRNQMIEILFQSFSKLSELSFTDTYNLFLEVMKKHESDDWFTNTRKIDFDHSFTLLIFNHLKMNLIDLNLSKKDSDFSFLPKYDDIVRGKLDNFVLPSSSGGNVDSYSAIIESHPDFEGRKNLFEEVKNRDLLHDLLTCLYEKVETTHNMKIVSSEQKTHLSHLEVLVCRSNFFYRMHHFGGHEASMMNESSTVRLIDLDDTSTNLLISLIYFLQEDEDYYKKIDNDYLCYE